MWFSTTAEHVSTRIVLLDEESRKTWSGGITPSPLSERKHGVYMHGASRNPLYMSGKHKLALNFKYYMRTWETNDEPSPIFSISTCAWTQCPNKHEQELPLNYVCGAQKIHDMVSWYRVKNRAMRRDDRRERDAATATIWQLTQKKRRVPWNVANCIEPHGRYMPIADIFPFHKA